jgi:hypothetical protein
MARRRGGAGPVPGAFSGAVLGAWLALVAVPLSAAAQQTVAGGFEDASLPHRGEARLRFGIVFEGTSDQFGGTDGTQGRTRALLGARFSADSLNAARIPGVADALRGLRDSVGVGTGLTLGTATTDLRVFVARVPFQLEFGITDRIAVSATIPIVKTQSSVQLRVNPGGTTGNVGFNPANSTATTGSTATAAQRNAQVQAQITNAARRLDSLVAACPAAASADTPAACANRAAATQLANTARTVANGIARVYGTGSTATPGALFVPVQGTDAQRAVENRIKALGTQFAAFSVNDLATPVFPFAATDRIAAAGLERILTEPEFGILADSLKGVTLQGTGDVDLAANATWLDTFGARGTAAGGFRIRSTAGVGYRLATGSVDLAFLPLDVPTGSGGPALLLRSATDLAFGRKLWLSGVARVESPFARDLVVRVPPASGALFTSETSELTASHRPGRLVEVQITPRWTPNEAFALAAQYQIRKRNADEYTGSFTVTDSGSAPLTVDASVLGAGTGGTAQLAGFGITYSTLGAFRRRRTWLPAEVSYLHTTTFSGSGGIVPRTRYDQLSIRIYAQILGNSTRRPSPVAATTSR